MARAPHAPPRLFGWRTVVVCVVVGVVVNVVVAWGLALLEQCSPASMRIERRLIRAGDVEAGDFLAADGARVFAAPSLGWPACGVATPGDLPDLAEAFEPAWFYGSTTTRWSSAWWPDPVYEVASGLPMRSVGRYFAGPDSAREHGWQIETGRSYGNAMLRLPARPLVVGFVGNTVFYGGVVFAGLVGAGALRRRRRVRRGRCVGCGYELAGLGVCPECGVVA